MDSIEQIIEWNRKASGEATMKERMIAKKKGFNEAKMKLITCHFPAKTLEDMDYLVRSELFPNRSEFIRFAVMNAVLEFKEGK